MKALIFTFATAALVSSGALATSIALAGPTRVPRTLPIVMHDPGCHSFMQAGHFTRTATVTGSVRLRNEDERTLKVTSGATVRRIPVGKTLIVGRGHYVITMVRQASDDNHLRLTVR